MKFLIVSTGCLIELERIIEREANKRLANPIYEFKYLNRHNNLANNDQDKPNFTTYLSEIDRAIAFQIWIPQKQ
jgi:hypothetical protein